MSKAAGNIKREPMDLPRAQVPRGVVHVITERCKQCDFCITYCPTKVLAYSEESNSKGYHYPVVVEGKEADCVNCRFCDLICPELAIYTTEYQAGKDETGSSDGG